MSIDTIAVPESVRSQFAGSLLSPDDAGYEEARHVHNGLIDKRPGAHRSVPHDR